MAASQFKKQNRRGLTKKFIYAILLCYLTFMAGMKTKNNGGKKNGGKYHFQRHVPG